MLVTRLPVPPWRGDQVRAYHHLRHLGPRHQITCCALLTHAPGTAVRRAVEALGVRLEVVPLGLVGALPALARAVTGDPRPLQVLLYDRPHARRRVAALLAAERFDVVHAQLVRTAAYLPAPAGPPFVMDLIDALSSSMARRAARERGPLGPVSACEARRLLRCERALMARAARTLVVSATERQELGGGERIVVVPNGVDLEAFPARAAPPEGSSILFFGNLGYFPNVDAASWLAYDIFPQVRAAVPDATLRLAGARPSRLVRILGGRPGVSLAADVPDMAAEIAAAAVVVAPMRAGGGLQNKVLEAMAVGAPVVTTPRVAAALEVEPGEHLLVADDAAGLADATVALLRDPARARAVAAAGRALVERRYQWAVSARSVEAAWEAAVAAGPATGV